MKFDIIQLNEPETGDLVVIAERLGGQPSDNFDIQQHGLKVTLHRVSAGGIDEDGNPFSLWSAGDDHQARPWSESFLWAMHYATCA